jgi:hypothetical protein
MMAEKLNTTTEARERPSDIVDQLRAAGVDYALTMKVLECVKAERAEAIAKTARLFYCRTAEHRPMTLSEFSDELNNTSRRLWGIAAAVGDVLRGRDDSVVERLAAAFDAERQIARKREARS